MVELEILNRKGEQMIKINVAATTMIKQVTELFKTHYKKQVIKIISGNPKTQKPQLQPTLNSLSHFNPTPILYPPVHACQFSLFVYALLTFSPFSSAEANSKFFRPTPAKIYSKPSLAKP
jgi:hypothetical protein